MNIYEALKSSYKTLSPYSDSQKWEFDSNFFHLSFLVAHTEKSAKILDMGCGIGILSLALKNLGYDVTGVDKYIFEKSNTYSVGDIENLKRIWQSQNISITAGDATGALQNLGKKFDVVVSIAVIEHQRLLHSFMDGLSEMTKSGGHIYIATPNGVNFLNRFRVLFGRAPMGNIKEFFNSGTAFTGHVREFTVEELATISKLAGLIPVEVGSKQTSKVRFTKNWRKWHVNLARIGAMILPKSGDTIYLWAKKAK